MHLKETNGLTLWGNGNGGLESLADWCCTMLNSNRIFEVMWEILGGYALFVAIQILMMRLIGQKQIREGNVLEFFSSFLGRALLIGTVVIFVPILLQRRSSFFSFRQAVVKD